MTDFNTPILFLIFNRPETTARVLAAIKKIKPSRLFIAADGPRSSVSGEADVCHRTRRLVLDNIDWPCEVKTLFREENLGCRRAVSSAIDWFFENVEEGIILEDDCLPNDDFFYFCSELLARYRLDERIFMISGNNFFPGRFRVRESYYFSNLVHIWGWATWRRAWKNYDVNMGDWPEFMAQGQIAAIWSDRAAQDYWLERFRETYAGRVDTWDHQWTYCLFRNRALSIVPRTNLVSNIGFGSGTHTLRRDQNADRPTELLGLPLIHPTEIGADRDADNYENRKLFIKDTTLKIILKKLRLFNLVKKIYRYALQNLRSRTE